MPWEDEVVLLGEEAMLSEEEAVPREHEAGDRIVSARATSAPGGRVDLRIETRRAVYVASKTARGIGSSDELFLFGGWHSGAVSCLATLVLGASAQTPSSLRSSFS